MRAQQAVRAESQFLELSFNGSYTGGIVVGECRFPVLYKHFHLGAEVVYCVLDKIVYIQRFIGEFPGRFGEFLYGLIEIVVHIHVTGVHCAGAELPVVAGIVYERCIYRFLHQVPCLVEACVRCAVAANRIIGVPVVYVYLFVGPSCVGYKLVQHFVVFYSFRCHAEAGQVAAVW